MPLIEVENVSKVFPLRRGPGGLFYNKRFSNIFRRRPRQLLEALHDISFTLDAGHSLGIIGANGSGKSTLLKILAGVTVPTTGNVRVYGRVASLLELGAGFHPLLTGRENIYLNARILGLSRADTDRVFDAIVEFSGIEDFIDNPVETYSSGMYVRIGFSVAIHANPDIFLVDEVLSVGDEEFQRKCRVRIGELKEQGKTIVFVSHDLSIVNTLCDRVVLLSKGQLLQRSTPRETIDFYLRQVGRECGIHTMGQGDLEAIASHGRVSVFNRQHEVSSPDGFIMNLLSMEQWHYSTAADWNIIDRAPNRCVGQGRMPRLPITLIWEIRLEEGRMVWSVALECEREATVEGINLHLLFPPAYKQWYYGITSGAFPEIIPGDLNWSVVASGDFLCRDAAIVAGPQDMFSPVSLHLEARGYSVRLELMNTDYVRGCRALQAAAYLAYEERLMPPGRHEIMELTVDFGMTVEDFEAWVKARVLERTLVSGDMSAVFDQGYVRLFYQEVEISSVVHLYTAMLFGNFWNGSRDFQWRPPVRSGNQLTISGESRRFPFRQHWELESTDDGVAFRVRLEAMEALTINEYHMSIGLIAGYEQWETPFESGEFGPFEPGVEDWRHLNRDYTSGTWIKARSATLPTVTLEVTTARPPFRMTALNTAVAESSRVLQALRTSESGVIHFEPGIYPYFEGRVCITAPEENAT